MAIDERAQATGSRTVADPPAPDRFPILDPGRWTDRHTWFAALGAVVVVVCWLVEAAQDGSANGIRAALGATIAVGIAGLALTLRGVTFSGLAVGGFVVFCGIMSWTFTSTRAVTWSVYGLGALLLVIWTFPWFRDALRLPRLGASWLGLAYWPLGVVSALLTAHWTVGAQRIAYFGVSAVAALAALVAARRTGRDPSVGVVAAFLLAVSALMVVGSGNVFDDVHKVPSNAWGFEQAGRFWGGPGFLYHPNSLALIGVLIALRIAPDRAFAAWQRWAALGVAGLVGVLTDSRTAWGFLFCAAIVHAAILIRRAWWKRRDKPLGDDELPTYRRAVVAAVIPFVLVGLVFVGMGGTGSLFQSRYQNTTADPTSDSETTDLTSGRLDTWRQVITDFKADGVVAKIFGNNADPRGAVTRVDTGPEGSRPELTTDNSAIGALRRAGILGCLAFALGLLLLLWRALRRNAPAWFAITVVASLSTVPWSDWMLGGVGGTFWIFLLAAEAWLITRPAAVADPVTRPAAVADPA